MVSPKDLREWRKANRYSQGKLAKLIGTTQVTVGNWELGKSRIPPFLGFVLTAVQSGLEPIGGQPERKRNSWSKGPRKKSVEKFSSKDSDNKLENILINPNISLDQPEVAAETSTNKPEPDFGEGAEEASPWDAALR